MPPQISSKVVDRALSGGGLPLVGIFPLDLHSIGELNVGPRTSGRRCAAVEGRQRQAEEPVELAKPGAIAVDVNDVDVVKRAGENRGGKDVVSRGIGIIGAWRPVPAPISV